MHNPDGAYHGPQRMRTALANDYVIALSQLLSQIGPSNVWRLAAPFGLDDIENAPDAGTLLFGGGNASLLDVAQAYSTFAHLGKSGRAAHQSR